MPNHIQLTPRTVPASAETIARRADAVQRLEDLDHLDASDGALNDTEVQWYATINGTEIPVLDFSVQKLDDGTVAVSLVAVVDTMSIGTPPSGSKPGGERGQAERNRMVVDRLEFAQSRSAGSEPQTRASGPVSASFNQAETGNAFLGGIRRHIRFGHTDGGDGMAGVPA